MKEKQYYEGLSYLDHGPRSSNEEEVFMASPDALLICWLCLGL
jgi:hypothetical protein